MPDYWRSVLATLKAFVFKRLGPWPVVGAVLLAAWWILGNRFGAWFDRQWSYFTGALNALLDMPVRTAGLLLLSLLVGLILWAFFDNSAVVGAIKSWFAQKRKAADAARDIQVLTSRVRELEGQVKVEVGLRNQWYEKHTFGRQLPSLPPFISMTELSC